MTKLKTLAAIAFFLLFAANAARAQFRDFLTDEEIEIVRDAQEIDSRIDVMVHAADRRFAVLRIDVTSPSAGKKERDEWGSLPKGERIELLFDIKRILQKAIDDLNNIDERPDSAILPDPDDKTSKKPKSLAELFPIAVRSLAAAATRFKPALEKELHATTDQKQKGVLLDSIDSCQQIIESVSKLPAEVVKPKKKN